MTSSSGYQHINGLRLFVHRFRDAAAAPSGLTIVLVHGFMDSGATWDLVAPALARAGHDVVAPDLRGFGLSDYVGAGGYYHFPDYVADLAALVDALAPRRLAIVGHSMGGTVAALYAGAHADRVERLALLEGTGPVATEPSIAVDRMQAWLRTMREVARTPKTLTSLQEAIERLALHHPRVPREVIETRAKLLTRADDAGRLLWAYDPLHRTTAPTPFNAESFQEFLRRIDCPTLVVGGGPTGWHPPDEASRIACLRHAVHVELPSAGHMMHWTEPAALAHHLAQFFAEAPKTRAPASAVGAPSGMPSGHAAAGVASGHPAVETPTSSGSAVTAPGAPSYAWMEAQAAAGVAHAGGAQVGGHAGMVHASPAQPGAAYPGAAHPGMAPPSPSYPGSGHPGAAPASPSQHGAAYSGAAPASPSQHGAAYPGAGHPGMAPASPSYPGAAYPAAAHPGAAPASPSYPGVPPASPSHPGVPPASPSHPGVAPAGHPSAAPAGSPAAAPAMTAPPAATPYPGLMSAPPSAAPAGAAAPGATPPPAAAPAGAPAPGAVPPPAATPPAAMSPAQPVPGRPIYGGAAADIGVGPVVPGPFAGSVPVVPTKPSGGQPGGGGNG